jgi:hypothetical protein
VSRLPDAHDFALKLMSNITGWPMSNGEILAALAAARRAS